MNKFEREWAATQGDERMVECSDTEFECRCARKARKPPSGRCGSWSD